MFDETTKRISRKLVTPFGWDAVIFRAGQLRIGINLIDCRMHGRTTHSWSFPVVVEDKDTSVDRKMRVFMDLESIPMRHLSDKELIDKFQSYIDGKISASPQ